MTVMFETVFLLQKHYGIARAEIAKQLLSLLAMPGIHLEGKRQLGRVFALYIDYEISFADAYHAVLAQHHGNGEIVSFDRDFDHLPGIERIGPPGPAVKRAA